MLYLYGSVCMFTTQHGTRVELYRGSCVHHWGVRFLGPNEIQRQIHPPFGCVHLLCTLALQLGGKPKREKPRVRLSRKTPPERVRERQPERSAFGIYQSLLLNEVLLHGGGELG